MKIMFISDIHGIKTNLDKIKKRYQELGCSKLVVLGDLYYIGPRNKLNSDYDINYVHEFLESFKDELICLKGNCDSEIDEDINSFPMIKGYTTIPVIEEDLYLTHGHIYNDTNWDKSNSILIFGHFHIPFIKKIESNLYINPGSISLPRGGSKASYLVYDNGKFTIYDMKDNIIDEINL